MSYIDLKENELNDWMLFFIVYVLKKNAAENKGITAQEIADELVCFQKPGGPGKKRTVERDLDGYFEVTKRKGNQDIAHLVTAILGGEIVRSDDKRNRKYRFIPCLNANSVEMINGSITSNKYLNEDEKEYLRHCLEIYTKPVYPASPGMSATATTQGALHKINNLQSAIKAKKQVIINYGEYVIEDSKIQLRPRWYSEKRKSHEMTLNPYALLWNEGAYYLIATFRDHTNIMHLRVDRIISVRIASDAKDRLPCPDTLVDFYKNINKNIFDPIKYTAIHPKMSIYDSADEFSYSRCTFRCKQKHISVLADTFGLENLMVREAPKETTEDTIVTLSVTCRVEEEAIILFCVQQCAILELVAPKKIKDKVREQLADIAEKYGM